MPNLFPTEDITEVQDETTEENQIVQFPRSWKFDYETGDFVQSPTGKAIQTEDIDAYIEWCQKALLTARYRYSIYTNKHGFEGEDLIGRGLTQAANESEIKRMVSECLMVDTRTAKVENFVFTWEGSDTVYYTCDVVTARGDTVQISNQVVIT